MSRPTFPAPRGESKVAAAVTLLVCAWFVAAAGGILAEPVASLASRTARASAAAPVAVAPQAHVTVVVEARRG